MPTTTKFHRPWAFRVREDPNDNGGDIGGDDYIIDFEHLYVRKYDASQFNRLAKVTLKFQG